MSSTFTRGFTLHARMYDAICGWEERRGLLEWRRVLVGSVTGDVLEVATGTGRNLSHYPSEARVFASEFDPVMLERAIPRAKEAQADVQLLLADGMKLPVADSSVDWVVIGLALCSIPDPAAAVVEAGRVLKPGGRLRFVEHVRDEDGTRRAKVQDFINPAWRTISGGCNCNRRSLELVRSQGFAIQEEQHFELGLPHIAPHVLAEATLL
jgi:ubiquinone/menaquinone biosynthesis C-methylase UbiE